jgi:Domain of unknown function (DUF4190)
METPPPTKQDNRASDVCLIAGLFSVLLYLLFFSISSLLFTLEKKSYSYPFELIFILSVIASIIAIYAGVISLRKIRKSHQGGIGKTTAGIILGALGLLITLFFLFIYLSIHPV